MDTAVDPAIDQVLALPRYRSILVALDSSDYADRGMADAAALARLWKARISGTHVYAAQLHDLRFRQMEGGLPAQFRAEQELERQRDVHDDLITRGLSIITDSYLDQAERQCAESGIEFARRPLEGKNYRALVTEANNGDYDLLIMGALGLGAIAGSRVGTVCRRVARRTDIDTLVIRNPDRALSDGPIVVALDGSRQAYGGLLTALALAGHWRVTVHAIAAFDPYYHYVAFNRIANVLSEEAGKVFRFREQEQLHEDIIDSGLAKIYQGHLSVARSIADDHGIKLETSLLDGKAHDAIEKYVGRHNPSLLIVGKRGIHADDGLDIGGNAEALLDNVSCSMLLSERCHKPRADIVSEITTSWTDEAERRLARTPSFVRDMARMAIMRYAQEQGHTVITERIVEEATAQLMPGRAMEAMGEIVALKDGKTAECAQSGMTTPAWSVAATELLEGVEPLPLRENLARRAEKKARQENSRQVETAHIVPFLDGGPAPEGPDGNALNWTAAALARLARVPAGFMREATRQRIEAYARHEGVAEIGIDVAEAGIGASRDAMTAGGGNQATTGGGPVSGQEASKCPFAGGADGVGVAVEGVPEDAGDSWTAGAARRLASVPEGYCRDMTRKAVSAVAAQRGVSTIDEGFVDAVMEVFESGSEAVRRTLPWDEEAVFRVDRAPEIVRGMLVSEIEGWALRRGLDRVDESAVDAVKEKWRHDGVFHLDPDDRRNN